MSNFFSNPHLTSPWTITSQGISADGDDDQRRLDAFLRANPDFRDAVLYAIRNSGQQAANAMSSAAAVGSNSPIAMVNACTSSNAGLAPSKPHRFEETIEKFLLRCQERAIKARTAQDIAAVIRNLSRFMTTSDPQMGEDPWVHLVNTTHISDFIDAQKKRSGKHMEASGKSSGLKASTLKKRLLDLGTFFRYAHKELKACMVNPVSDLDHRLADLGRVAAKTTAHYAPFTDADIRQIFKPEEYLANNRDPDYFWCPLLAAHLGGRLGEFVMATVNDIGKDKYGVWYLAVQESVAKNNNSARLIPLTQPLLDLGFLDYVEHVRELGATQLWPHRDLSSTTAQRLPTKNQSQAFGSYLTKQGLESTSLVFHSFRHTVVSALLDAGTPVHVSMQLCGHEAQAAAIKRGLITEKEARSVHMDDYAHADVPRLGMNSPLFAMKEALEKAVVLPIDYPRLKSAAKVVLQHTRKVAGKFTSGWPAQRTKYTEMQVARLEDGLTCVPNISTGQ